MTARDDYPSLYGFSISTASAWSSSGDARRALSEIDALRSTVDALRKQAARFLTAVDDHFDHPMMDYTPETAESIARWDEMEKARTELFITLANAAVAGVATETPEATP